MRDPGLQPERTTMAWTRTAAGLLLNAILNLRVGFVADSTPLIILSAALLVAAAATFYYGRERRIALSGNAYRQPLSPKAAVLVSLAVWLTTVTGLTSIGVAHIN
ncbi:MAG: DUF202 domain-containing protein [Variovorax paradoxus]|uniref:DUF202 domain-containing protein n=1 Tax=Variovorax paradoxus TaxID=34073 RepID=A0A2W5QKY6_VARPD|nr:MAG: DUF202 domain-containing protein [Variovorax paradoxus]